MFVVGWGGAGRATLECPPNLQFINLLWWLAATETDCWLSPPSCRRQSEAEVKARESKLGAALEEAQRLRLLLEEARAASTARAGVSREEHARVVAENRQLAAQVGDAAAILTSRRAPPACRPCPCACSPARRSCTCSLQKQELVGAFSKLIDVLLLNTDDTASPLPACPPACCRSRSWWAPSARPAS